jgi:hypothetical protein
LQQAKLELLVWIEVGRQQATFVQNRRRLIGAKRDQVAAFSTSIQADVAGVFIQSQNEEQTHEVESLEVVELNQSREESQLEVSQLTAQSLMAESVTQVEVDSSAVEVDAVEANVEFESNYDSDTLMQEIATAAGSGKTTLLGTVAGNGSRGSSGGGKPREIVGRFFDLKQDRKRGRLDYTGSFPDYIRTVNQLADAGLTDDALFKYYQANTQLTFSQLLIPASTSANDAPKAFNVDGEVEPRGWFVHYSGTVIPPEKGEWRFVGFFDDMLIAYINGQPVLDGSWVPMCNVGEGPYDNSLRQEFGGPSVSGDRTAYVGKWVKLSGPTKIDILIGETPGGLVGGLLMCQFRGVNYPTRSDGTPILPLFATSHDGSDRIRQEPFARAYGLLDNSPIWKPAAKR